MNFKKIMLYLFLWIGVFTYPLSAATKIGVIAALQGKVEILVDAKSNQKNPAKIGDAVNENQIVITQENSKAQILLKDQTTLSVGPNSEVVIDEFILGSLNDKGTLSASFKKGLFKYTSGKIATDKGNVKINVPNTVITVRGTEFVGNIEPNKTSVILLSGAITLTSLNTVQDVARSGYGVTIAGPGLISPPAAIPTSELKQVFDAVKVSATNKPLNTTAEVSAQSSTSNTSEKKPEATTQNIVDNNLDANGKPKPKFDAVVQSTSVQNNNDKPTPIPVVDNTLDANGKPKSSFDNVVTQNIMKEDTKSTSDVKETLAKNFTDTNNIPSVTDGVFRSGLTGATLAQIYTYGGTQQQYTQTFYDAVGHCGNASGCATTFSAGQIVGKLELYINGVTQSISDKLNVTVSGGGANYFYVEDGYIKTKVPSSAFFASGGWVGKNNGRVNLELKDAAGNTITTINGIDFVNH